MSILTIAFLFLFVPHVDFINATNVDINVYNMQDINTTLVIDSTDRVVFYLDQFLVNGDIIEIPVYIESDEVINTLDFSMFVDTNNLEYESIVDHTGGGLQYAAFLNPNDLKLRFTSNSFESYPVWPQKVVSIRFKVLNGVVARSDFQSLVTYLNGDRCSAELEGKGFMVSSTEIEVSKLNVSPNPASEWISIEIEKDATLDMFDCQGRSIIQGYNLYTDRLNNINVQSFSRGSYTLRLVYGNRKVQTRKIVLQ